MSEPTTLLEAIRYFSDPDICQDFMVSLRWPDGVVTCPTCGRTDVRYISTRRLWECKEKHARRQFSVKVGTIFEDSAIGVDKWLAAIWMIANAKNGVSSYEIHRSLGVTQKTAWFMLHRIRLAMQSDDLGPIGGEVEVDETFIGGLARFMHKDKRIDKIKGTGTVGKTAVLGLLERHGPDGHSTIRAKVVSSRRRRVLSPEVRSHVTAGATVYTDALKSYADLQSDYTHHVIDHAERYVEYKILPDGSEGKIHTNGIENFWSLLKRALKGTYVSVEPFHLFRYLDEESFRFNTRKTADADRFWLASSGITGKRLTYQELIGATATPA